VVGNVAPVQVFLFHWRCTSEIFAVGGITRWNKHTGVNSQGSLRARCKSMTLCVMFLHLRLKSYTASLAHFLSSSVRIPLRSEFLSIYNTTLSAWCLVSYCEKIMKAVRNEISCRIQYRQQALQWAREIQTDFNIFTITSDVIKIMISVPFVSPQLVVPPRQHYDVSGSPEGFWSDGVSYTLIHSHPHNPTHTMPSLTDQLHKIEYI
jgi:hypothetical protein